MKLKVGVAFSLVVVLFAVAGSSGAAADTTLNYTVDPSYVYGFAAPSSPGAFPTPSQCVATSGSDCYTPQEIRKAYNIPSSSTGAGQTIVIVDAYGSPTLQSDLRSFDATMGLPDPTLNVFYPGGSPTYNPLQNHDELSWAAETSLDVQWSHAIAPRATIDLVVGANSNGNVLNNAVQYAVDNHLGNVISLSFGFPEGVVSGNNGNNGQVSQMHSILAAARAAGITVLVSSGDFGGNNFFPFVNAAYPASDPNVTSVGGTNLFLKDDGTYVSEDVWNDSDPLLCPYGCNSGIYGATGGAPSLLFPGVTTSTVSYNASVYTAVMVYLSFPGLTPGLYFIGGTSEGAPQWAGIVAGADQAAGRSLGYLNDKLAAIASGKRYAADFHDVTVGQNGFFGPGESAGVGYDMPTGYGTPNVANLLRDLTK